MTKLNVNYAKAIVDELYEDFDIITNTHSEKIRITANKVDEIWDALVVVKIRFFMTTCTSGDIYNLKIEENGLVPNHSYTLLSVKEVNSSS